MVGILELWCRNWGGREATGPPNIWQISQPYSNRGGQIVPTYYYWPPQCFSPSGITGKYLVDYARM